MKTLEVRMALRRRQADVFRSPQRFIVLVAGRRWGKTTLALAWLIASAAMKTHQTCYYVAPTCRQAKRIAWERLKQLLPVDARRKTNEQELLVRLRNGSSLQLHGADHPDNLRGVGLSHVVLDEFADMSIETWTTVIRPMLADQRGRAMFIGTPKGFNHFYDLYLNAKSLEGWAAYHYRTSEGGYVSASELEQARSETDIAIYSQEFLAEFRSSLGRVYYAFDRVENVFQTTEAQAAQLMIGMDFNVNPMTAVVAALVGKQCHVLDEVVLVNSNTMEMMQEINRRYPGRQGVVYPDPSCTSRKTSAPGGQTDFTLIRAAGWPVYIPPRVYPIVDRINSVNAMLCNANGARRLFVKATCRNLIRALDGLPYREGTRMPDKRSGLDHITDALGYLIMAAFPVVTRSISVGQVAL